MKGWRFCISVVFLSLLLVVCGCGSDDVTKPEDETPDPVSSTVPPDGATDVLLDVVISAVFLEDIDPSSITDSTFTLSYNPLVPGTVAYDPETKTATFTPDDSLEYDTKYTVTIIAEPAGAVGKGFPTSISWIWSFYSVPGQSGIIELPRTGQTTSYYSGDDGDYQTGVVWPAPRFTDNGDGTLMDNLTGLMWLKDAHCLGFQSWQYGAFHEIDSLNYFPETCDCQDYTAQYYDWRMPNVIELESLINVGQHHMASWLINQGFVNVQALHYWSSTIYPHNAGNVRCVNMWVGTVEYEEKYGARPIWAVRGESTAPSRIWKTGQTTSYRPGDDGELQAGEKWPIPRFYVNIGNAAVTDLLTKLVWLRSADTPSIGQCTGGRMTWQEALDYITCLNDMEYLGCSDWRLPNRKELFSLIDHSKYYPALPSDNQFHNVQNSKYWTSTTYAYGTSEAWIVEIAVGYVNPWAKTNTAWVWPMRGGQ